MVKISFISLEKWPKIDESKINLELGYLEEELDNTFEDIDYIMKLTKKEKLNKIIIVISQEWKYGLYEEANELLTKIKSPGELIKELMKTDMKKHGQELVKLIPKLVEKKLDVIVGKSKEIEFFNKNKDRIEKQFGCEIVIEDGDKFKHDKSRFALPGKPAILIQ